MLPRPFVIFFQSLCLELLALSPPHFRQCPDCDNNNN